MSRRRSIGTWLLVGAVLAACQRNLEEENLSAPEPPPAALIAPVEASTPLDEKLARLELELEAAAAGELRDSAELHMLRAEAITDRIVEGGAPFPWLATDYYVDARLRQLQLLADRIIARLRRDEPREEILREILDLRQAAAELRGELRKGGGGVPPPPLDSLLAGLEPDTLPPPPTDEPVH